MPTVVLSRDGPAAHSLVAAFPYSPEITAVMRDLPGREFHAVRRVWTFPLTPENVLQLYERLRVLGWGLIIPPDVRTELRATADAVRDAALVRKAGDSDIAFDYFTQPYAHQRAGLAFLARLGSGGLTWEMGLGKTKTAIDYAEWISESGSDHNANLRVLVICPKTVARNWTAEIEKHAGHSDYAFLAHGAMAKRIPALATARYSIVNCEALSLAPMAKAIKAIEWDLVIVDESTRFKTPKAARTKTLHKLNAKRRVILTGTPITGKPQDAWSQFEFVSPGLFGKNYWAFEQRYLAKDWFGNVTGLQPSTADELRNRIDSRSYRILKADVLDLPPKVYTDRRVTMTTEQAALYAQMRDELRIEIEGNPRLTANNILTMLLRLTQITAGLVGSNDTGYRWLEDNAKVAELDAMLDELGNEQVVIFGLYQKELEALSARYDTGGLVVSLADAASRVPPIIYGPTPEAVRHQLVTEFQAGDRRLLFAQVRTGGIGINLTAAKTAIYYSRDWSLESYLQSQDRLHRIGQTGTVSIVHLVAEGTIDDDIAKAIIEKQQLSDILTGDGARKLAREVLAQ